jgi:hypothetical protein
MVHRICQTAEDGPPIVEQGGHVRNILRDRECTRREAAPAPMVLDLIKNVLDVGAITIELSNGWYVVRQRRDQYLILEIAFHHVCLAHIDNVLRRLLGLRDIRSA